MADAAVGELTGAARAYLHRQVALALEPVARASVPSDVTLLWACAAHWAGAGEREQALKLAISCGAYLLEVGRPTDATEVYNSSEPYISTSAERQAWRVGFAVALLACGQYRQARELLTAALAYAAESGATDEVRAVLELDLLDAEYLATADGARVLQRSHQLAELPTLSPNLRLQFAIRALRFAEELGLPAAMHRAFCSARKVTQHGGVGRQHQAKLEMIYHGVCGDLSLAEQAAQSLLEYQSSGHLPPADRARALRNTAYVYLRCGRLDECETLLVESALLAESSHLVVEAHLSCYVLAERYLYVGDNASAAEWCAKAELWGNQVDDRWTAASGRYLRAKIALLDGRRSDAIAAFPETEAAVLAITSPYQRATCAAVFIHLHLEHQGIDDPSPITIDFRRVFEQVRALGDQDYPAFVAYLLGRQVNADVAGAELRSYVEVQRRERGPLPPFLARCVAPS
jgi:tetratricopeptide (TPR) repeat protein